MPSPLRCTTGWQSDATATCRIVVASRLQLRAQQHCSQAINGFWIVEAAGPATESLGVVEQLRVSSESGAAQKPSFDDPSMVRSAGRRNDLDLRARFTDTSTSFGRFSRK
jgi:hypothetical protein